MINPEPGDYIYVLQSWDKKKFPEPLLCLVAQDKNENLIWNHDAGISTFLVHGRKIPGLPRWVSLPESEVYTDYEKRAEVYYNLTIIQQFSHFIWVVSDSEFYRPLEEK